MQCTPSSSPEREACRLEVSEVHPGPGSDATSGVAYADVDDELHTFCPECATAKANVLDPSSRFCGNERGSHADAIAAASVQPIRPRALRLKWLRRSTGCPSSSACSASGPRPRARIRTDEWRVFSDGINLHVFCPECAEREFGTSNLRKGIAAQRLTFPGCSHAVRGRQSLCDARTPDPHRRDSDSLYLLRSSGRLGRSVGSEEAGLVRTGSTHRRHSCLPAAGSRSRTRSPTTSGGPTSNADDRLPGPAGAPVARQ